MSNQTNKLNKLVRAEMAGGAEMLEARELVKMMKRRSAGEELSKLESIFSILDKGSRSMQDTARQWRQEDRIKPDES